MCNKSVAIVFIVIYRCPFHFVVLLGAPFYISLISNALTQWHIVLGVIRQLHEIGLHNQTAHAQRSLCAITLSHEKAFATRFIRNVTLWDDLSQYEFFDTLFSSPLHSDNRRRSWFGDLNRNFHFMHYAYIGVTEHAHTITQSHWFIYYYAAPHAPRTHTLTHSHIQIADKGLFYFIISSTSLIVFDRNNCEKCSLFHNFCVVFVAFWSFPKSHSAFRCLASSQFTNCHLAFNKRQSQNIIKASRVRVEFWFLFWFIFNIICVHLSNCICCVNSVWILLQIKIKWWRLLFVSYMFFCFQIRVVNVHFSSKHANF